MNHHATITIGGLPIKIGCTSGKFLEMLEQRYGKFIRVGGDARSVPGTLSLPSPTKGCGRGYKTIQLDIELIEPSSTADPDADLEVRFEQGRWHMRRGDFVAYWDPATLRGVVRQAGFPYALDSIIRIIHSLVLAKTGGGFLLHAASAVRNGRAFLFSGISGAGKTTISRLAPADAILLTDEISYIRREAGGYQAFGTPFAGELGIAGEDIAAPIGALYFLRQGTRNVIVPVDAAGAARMLLRNILFFADDSRLVDKLFAGACDFVGKVAIHELTFRPESEVWDLIA